MENVYLYILHLKQIQSYHLPELENTISKHALAYIRLKGKKCKHQLIVVQILQGSEKIYLLLYLLN